MKVSIPRPIKSLALRTKDLLYPATCAVCGVFLKMGDLAHICPSCWARITPNRPPYCKKCGRSVFGMAKDLHICGPCRQKKFKFDFALSPWLYEGVIKECIHKFKYEAKTLLYKAFVENLTNFAKKHLDMGEVDLIMPVPLGRAKFIDRQFNQSQLLARGFAKKLSLKAS